MQSYLEKVAEEKMLKISGQMTHMLDENVFNTCLFCLGSVSMVFFLFYFLFPFEDCGYAKFD